MRATHLEQIALNSSLSTMSGACTALWSVLVACWVVGWLAAGIAISHLQPSNPCRGQLANLTSYHIVLVCMVVGLFLFTWVWECCQKPNWKRDAEMDFFSREELHRRVAGRNRTLEQDIANDPKYPQARRKAAARAADVGDSSLPPTSSGRRVQFFDDPIGESASSVRPRTATQNTDARIIEMAARAAQYVELAEEEAVTPPPAAAPSTLATNRTQYDDVHPYSPVGSSVASRRVGLLDGETPAQLPRGGTGVHFSKANPMRDALNEAMKSKGHAAIAQKTQQHRMYENSLRLQASGASAHNFASGLRLEYDDPLQFSFAEGRPQQAPLTPMSVDETNHYLDLLGITHHSHRSLTGTESARSEDGRTNDYY